MNGTKTAVSIALSKKIYSKAAVLKSCYAFSKDLSFEIFDRESDLEVAATLRSTTPSLENPTVRTIDQWLPELLNAFIDFQLRAEIQAETASVRELIVAKAFSEAGILEDPPPGTFADSVKLGSADLQPLVNISPHSKE